MADALAALTPEAQIQSVRAWAEDVWQAYTAQHALGRGWIQAALHSKSRR